MRGRTRASRKQAGRAAIIAAALLLAAPPGPAAPRGEVLLSVAGGVAVYSGAPHRPRPRPWLARTRLPQPQGTAVIRPAAEPAIARPAPPPPAGTAIAPLRAPIPGLQSGAGIPLGRAGRVAVFTGAALRPRPRPARLRPEGGGAEAVPLAVLPERLARGLPATMRNAPAAAPRSPRPAASPAATIVARSATPAGARAVCGRRDIIATPLPAIHGPGGCGIPRPVSLERVGGVKVTGPATVNCDTARALSRWVRDSLRPTVGRLGGGVVEIGTFAGYACRTRNGRRGAKLSEHARGNAIDVGWIRLANGRKVTVREGWGNRAERRLLEKLHRGACGPFGTVLGPRADHHHRDHFHFDVARHRGRLYCR